MSKLVIGIFGAGGHGKETLAIMQETDWFEQNPKFMSAEIVFIETLPTVHNVHGIKVVSESEFLEIDCEQKFVVIALGDSKSRKKISERFQKLDIEFLNVVSTKSHVDQFAQIQIGAIISPLAYISTDVTIGCFFQANANSSVSHDCLIGNFVTLSPGAILNGNVEIGNNVFIGSGAIVRNGNSSQRITIGDNSIVGMGAVVTKSIGSNLTVVGNPARQIK